jgi:hypothetical protein
MQNILGVTWQCFSDPEKYSVTYDPQVLSLGIYPYVSTKQILAAVANWKTIGR